MKVKLLQDIEGNNIYPLSSMNTVINDKGNPLQLELYQYRDEIKRLSKIPLTKAGDGTLYLANDGKYKELPVNVNELVYITLSSNQDLKDILGATITIDLEGGSQKTYIWNGNVITLDLIYGTDYTINVSNINGYATPESKTFTAIAANTRRVEMVYTASVISFDSNVLAQVLVNDLLINTNETIKVPFGSIVNIVPQDLEGYTAPQPITIMADAINKEVVLSYIQSSLEINVLSNQTNDETILNISVNVSYNNTTVEVKNGFTTIIPVNSEVTILFPEVEGYKKPEDIVFTYTGGYIKKTGIYYTELLTVNVSADQGSVSGFEVTISKQEVVGVATKYTKLEYIESTGTQYINTGFIPNQDTRIEILTGITSVANASKGDGYIPYGAGINYNDSAYECYSVNNTFNINYSNQTYKIGTITSGHKVRVSHNKEKLSVTDETSGETWTHTFNYGNYSVPNTMTICAINRSSGILCGKMKLYSCKIYDNGTLIRDYIPALRSDGIAGLYDVVNDTFTASNGTSNFNYTATEPAIVAKQTSVTGTYKIPYDNSYTVSASNVSGYTTPKSVTRIASAVSHVLEQKYEVIKVKDLSLFDVYGNSINRSTANCYVIREAGQYKIPLVYGNAIKNGKVNTAAFTNNGGVNSHDFVNGYGFKILQPYINVDIDPIDINCMVENGDCADTNISSLSVDDNLDYIQFTIVEVPSEGGNVIISICNGNEVFWSWHIWLWPHDLTPVEITNSTGVKYNIMPVNLASKYDSDGVHIKNWFYQWGRKDPMLLPSAWNSTTDHTPGSIIKTSKASGIKEGILRSNVFYYNSSSPYNWFGDKSYYNLWDAACTGTGVSDNDTVKTVYDPCPVGWKVPNGNVFTGFSKTNVVGSFDGGWKFKRYSGDTVGVFFPVSGCRYHSEGLLYGVGSGGYVWLSSAHSQNLAYSMHFTFDSVHQQNVKYRAYGYSVRPVQDEDLELAPHELLIEVPEVNGFTVTITNNSGEILATQTDSLQLHSIPWGTTYTITCSDVPGYITPEPQTYVASISRRELQLNYIKQPSVSVNIKSNQLNDNLTIKAKLYRGNNIVGYIGNGDSYVFSGTEYNWKLEFSEIAGYKTPDPIEFEWYGLEDVQLEATYLCELLTVNVSADNGSISGFEVTIAKTEFVGIAEKYTRLEYIESTGTQYIDTGFKPNNNTKVELEAYANNSQWTFGCWDSSSSAQFGFSCNGSYGFRYGSQSYGDGKKTAGKIKVVMDKTYYSLYINDEIEGFDNFNNEVFQCQHSMYLCAINNGGSVSSGKFQGKIYSFKVYDNSNLIRDYIPALRSDGIAGLYDSVNDTFTTSSGNANFIAGDEASEIFVTQTSVTGSYKIPFGIEYIVYASYKDGYTTPMPQSFTANQTARIYNIQYTHRPGTLNPSYGVYIQDTEGYCYTESEWDGSKTVNGIAVVTENCSFVLAVASVFVQTDFSNLNVSIDGVTSANSTNDAMLDFDGERQTTTIINKLGDSALAANAARDYIFPNGKKGYLGAAGEWKAVIDNAAKVNSALGLFGDMWLNRMCWTSTMNYNRIWAVASYNTTKFTTHSNDDYLFVWPFASL